MRVLTEEPFVGYKCYGPYDHSDMSGRKQVVLISPTDERHTLTVARLVMCTHLGRLLDSSEEVDHIDNDCTNDALENLQLLTKAANVAKSNPVRSAYFECPACGIQFELRGKRLAEYKSNHRRKPSMTGPYCSKSCADRAGK